MTTLSFGDFVFHCDESTLKLVDEENIKVFSSPISSPKVQSLGRKPRVLTGEAVYKSENGILRYGVLHSLIGTVATLKTPLCEMTARLFKVELSGEKNIDKIRFNFSFCEVE